MCLLELCSWNAPILVQVFVAFVFRCSAFDAGIDVALSMQCEVQSLWRIVLLCGALFFR